MISFLFFLYLLRFPKSISIIKIVLFFLKKSIEEFNISYSKPSTSILARLGKSIFDMFLIVFNSHISEFFLYLSNLFLEM